VHGAWITNRIAGAADVGREAVNRMVAPKKALIFAPFVWSDLNAAKERVSFLSGSDTSLTVSGISDAPSTAAV
jgi:hypothetical protein